MQPTTRPPRVTLVQDDGHSYDLTREVVDWTGVPGAELCTIILGDPADLYVCSDAAGFSGGRPHTWYSTPASLASDDLIRLGQTVVTGSSAQRVPAGDPETRRVILDIAMRALVDRSGQRGQASLWAVLLLAVIVPLLLVAAHGMGAVAAALGR